MSSNWPSPTLRRCSAIPARLIFHSVRLPGWKLSDARSMSSCAPLGFCGRPLRPLSALCPNSNGPGSLRCLHRRAAALISNVILGSMRSGGGCHSISTRSNFRGGTARRCTAQRANGGISRIGESRRHAGRKLSARCADDALGSSSIDGAALGNSKPSSRHGACGHG